MKFLITEASGKQFELETDKSHSQLLMDFSATTDIQPIVELVEEDKQVKKPKAAAK